MNYDRWQQNQEIVKTALYGLVLGGLFVTTAYLALSGYQVQWPWWPGISGAAICAVLGISLLPIVLIGRSAYKFQVMVAIMSTGWLLPFLAAGFDLTSWSVSEILWVLALCGANGLATFSATMQKLTAPDFEADRAGRLDLSAGLWNIAKPLFRESQKNAGNKLARLLIPLASGLGATLFGIGGQKASLFYAALMFVLAFLLVRWAATHAAAAIYLKQLENRLGRHVVV